MATKKTSSPQIKKSKRKITSTDSKLKNKKNIIDGIEFDSILEGDYYIYLKNLKATGEIYDFEIKPVFLLIPAFKKNGKQYRDMEYIGDFKVFRSDKENDFYIVDTKGFKTDTFQIKEKLFHYFYRDIELLLLTFDGPTKRWVTLEEHKKLIQDRKKERAKKKVEKEALAEAKKSAKAFKSKKGRKTN